MYNPRRDNRIIRNVIEEVTGTEVFATYIDKRSYGLRTAFAFHRDVTPVTLTKAFAAIKAMMSTLDNTIRVELRECVDECYGMLYYKICLHRTI